MRSRMSSRNHPIQPLSPKHQPWARTQAPDRKVANVTMSRSLKEKRALGMPTRTVEEELVIRARIEQKSAEKQEKLQEAVDHARYVRRRQRQRAPSQMGELVKQELNKANP